MRRLARCCQRGEKGFEGSGSAQSPEALPYAVPRTEFGGKSAPGDVVNDKILQGFQEVPVVPSLVAAPRARLPKQLHQRADPNDPNGAPTRWSQNFRWPVLGVPIPKFALVCGTLECELRNQRNTRNINVFECGLWI